jgi:hypothetical protein
LRYHKPGTAFDFRELSVTAGAEVAFAVAIAGCGPGSSSDADLISAVVANIWEMS